MKAFVRIKTKTMFNLWKNRYKKTRSGNNSIKKEKVILKQQWRAILKQRLKKEINEKDIS